MLETKFNFEDLEVWQKAAEFSKKVIDLSEKIDTNRKHFRLIEQLEGAASSIALNIAEGKGRYSKKEFVQFLNIAHGSPFETVSLLILFNRNKWISDNQLDTMKTEAAEISRMLSGLISSIKRSIP